MSAIPLADVDTADAPDEAMLRGRLADLPLPDRTLALLGDSRRPMSDVRCPMSTSDVALRQAQDVVSVSNHGHRTSDDAMGDLRDGLGALVDHLVDGDTDAVVYQRAASRLVGLGPGLTPTGDDLLVALVAASRLLSGAGRHANGGAALISSAAAGALAAAVAALPPAATTDVAHGLLRESAAGRFPEPLAAFVRALGDRDVDGATLARLADRLASTGAHSGADWLAGVVALVRACLAENTA